MCMAALFGASVLEKHFTHDKSLLGNDHYHAMDKDDLLKFTKELANFRKLYGSSERNLGLGSRRKVAREEKYCCSKRY